MNLPHPGRRVRLRLEQQWRISRSFQVRNFRDQPSDEFHCNSARKRVNVRLTDLMTSPNDIPIIKSNAVTITLSNYAIISLAEAYFRAIFSF